MRKFIFIWASILILLSLLSVSSQTVSQDTSQTTKDISKQQEQFESLKKELDELRKDNYAKAMENAEKSIGLANFMIRVLIVAVGILTAFGVFNYIKTGQIRKKIEEEVKEIRELKEKMKDEFRQEFEKTVNLRCEIESRKTEAETLMTNIKTIFEDVKKIAKDIEKAGREIDQKKQSVDESKTEVSAISYLKDGGRFHLEKKYEKAIEEYKKATELKPDFASAWYNMACVYSLQNKKKEALENLKRAIEFDPKYKEMAKKDKDFKNLWEDEDFKKLVE